MWTTRDPAAYDAALRSPSRQWRSRIDVIYGSEVASSLNVMLSGSVSIDDVAVRRSCSLDLVDPTGTLAPAEATDLLAPKGTEVRPYRGLVLADGSVSWVPLGVMGVVNPEVSSQSGQTLITLKGNDRVDAIRARRFTAPWVIAAGTPTRDAIASIVTSRLPVDTRLTVTGATTPALVYDALSDPWDAVRDLARADDLVAFFDPLGSLAVQPNVPVETDVVYQPEPGGLMLVDQGVKRTLTADSTYSGVIVAAEHPDRDPIRVEVWDLDPTSPTYADGPFGRRPYGFSSPVITSAAMGLTTGQRILARVSRMRQEAVLRTMGHPGHEVGDIVTVIDPATRTSGRWVVTGGDIFMRATSGPITLKLQEAPGD